MTENFSLSDFNLLFPDNDACLNKIRRIRFPKGVFCISCKKVTQHYRVKNRTAYTCKVCRNQIYPLAGTIFEKSATPLRFWFFVMYLMVKTKGEVSAKQIQRELGVTYKTAWRMRSLIYKLMEQNNGELLAKDHEENTIRKWTFFKRLTFSVTETQKETT